MNKKLFILLVFTHVWCFASDKNIKSAAYVSAVCSAPYTQATSSSMSTASSASTSVACAGSTKSGSSSISAQQAAKSSEALLKQSATTKEETAEEILKEISEVEQRISALTGELEELKRKQHNLYSQKRIVQEKAILGKIQYHVVSTEQPIKARIKLWNGKHASIELYPSDHVLTVKKQLLVTEGVIPKSFLLRGKELAREGTVQDVQIKPEDLIYCN